MTTTSSDNYTVNGVRDQDHSLGLEDVVANGLEVDDSPPMKSILYHDGKKVTEFRDLYVKPNGGVTTDNPESSSDINSRHIDYDAVRTICRLEPGLKTPLEEVPEGAVKGDHSIDTEDKGHPVLYGGSIVDGDGELIEVEPTVQSGDRKPAEFDRIYIEDGDVIGERAGVTYDINEFLDDRYIRQKTSAPQKDVREVYDAEELAEDEEATVSDVVYLDRELNTERGL
jgi:hypothetical protein